MTEFTFLYYGAARASSKGEMHEAYEKWALWFERLEKYGSLVSIGQPLDETGKEIAGTSKRISDGPFAETKEIVCG